MPYTKSIFHPLWTQQKYDRTPTLSSAGKLSNPIASGKSMGRTRTTTKRPRRRRGRRGGKRRIRRIPPQLAPMRKVVKLKSTFHLSVSAADGSLDSEQIQLNAMSDARAAGGAEQPLGYDQWAAFYKKYTVIGYKVFVTFANHAAYATCVGVHVSTTSTPKTAYEHYRELPGTAMKVLTSDIDHCVVAAKGSVKRFFPGVKLMSEDEANGTLETDGSGVDPSANYAVWLHVFQQHIAHTAEATNISAIVSIERIVVLWDRIIPARSTD